MVLLISIPDRSTAYAYEGDFRVSSWEFTMNMEYGSDIMVTVYYPGYRGPLERYRRNQEAPFPVVVFSPGAGSSATDYESILIELASYGFIVAGASWHYERDRERDTAHTDHTVLLDSLEEFNKDQDNPLYGLVDTGRCGAFGHSRGGRAAFMASGSDPRIDNIVAWMPTLNNASSVNQNSYKYLFGGDEDEISSPGEWLDPLYYSCEETIAYLNVFGGDHQPTQDIHIDLTIKFFRNHLLGEDYLEDDLYGLGIRERADSREFHLRMKRHGSEYDSHPELSPDRSVEEENEDDVKKTPFLDPIDLMLISILIIMIFLGDHRRYTPGEG